MCLCDLYKSVLHVNSFFQQSPGSSVQLTMVVAELLSNGAPPVLVLLVLHLISTPELSSSEAALLKEHQLIMHRLNSSVDSGLRLRRIFFWSWQSERYAVLCQDLTYW